MDIVKIKVIEEFEHFDDETKSNVKIPRGLKHILVFGQSRQGKSSIINMMTGKDAMNGAKVSSNVMECTFSTKPWMNDKYCFWDTAGLNEEDESLLNKNNYISAFRKFLKNSKGAIMVVSWNNLNSYITKNNWQLFYDTFLNQKVPLIICITGRAMVSSDEDQIWLNEQQTIIKEMGYFSKNGNPFKCVVYSKDLSEIKECFRTEYNLLRERSIGFINELLAQNVNNEFYNPKKQKGYLMILKKIWNYFEKYIRIGVVIFICYYFYRNYFNPKDENIYDISPDK